MTEKCPLKGGQLYWDGQIPDVCHANCYDKWDGISSKPALGVDEFSKSCEASPEICTHEVEFNGEVLQRSTDSSDTWRGYGLNYACARTGEELFAEDYEFHCDNNDPTAPRERNPFDTFLEPWSLSDLEKIGVDMERAARCSDILYSNLSIQDAYGAIYKLYLDGSSSDNDQTRLHLMDTLIRLQHVYNLDAATADEIVKKIHEDTSPTGS
jgi:hypothetical protein